MQYFVTSEDLQWFEHWKKRSVLPGQHPETSCGSTNGPDELAFYAKVAFDIVSSLRLEGLRASTGPTTT
jgi:hypothetical protein